MQGLLQEKALPIINIKVNRVVNLRHLAQDIFFIGYRLRFPLWIFTLYTADFTVMLGGD